MVVTKYLTVLSGKYPAIFYRIVPDVVSGSSTSLVLKTGNSESWDLNGICNRNVLLGFCLGKQD
jgi:hypothetical protein